MSFLCPIFENSIIEENSASLISWQGIVGSKNSDISVHTSSVHGNGVCVKRELNFKILTFNIPLF